MGFLTDEEWTWLRAQVDKACPYHTEEPHPAGTSLAGHKKPCLHVTLGKIQGMEIDLDRGR